MPSPIAYFDTAMPVKAEPTLLQRVLRVVQIVATCWTLLGAGVNFFALDHPSLKARVFGIGCLLIAAAMYSVLIPLYYVTRSKIPNRNA
jgi:hypothetical protein